jgi:glycosyltransferase involved in cell wall biosynthesis
MTKISVILPYKENFSPTYAGAVSLHVEHISQNSIFKKNIQVFGNTKYKKKFKSNYTNITFNQLFLSSNQKKYIKNFIEIEKSNPSTLIEIHNRPLYLKQLTENLNRKFVFHYHNDPLTMNGSRLPSERIFMINNCEKIIFISEWVKKRFLKNINENYLDEDKFIIINHSINKKKINFAKKKKIITFVGRLNSSKGYDLFGKSIIKILDKHKDWYAHVAGDEPREKLDFYHDRLIKHGFINHDEILKLYEKSSIAVTCSRWEEPFGRTSLEASSRGCAVIVSNRGGLNETVTNAVKLKDLNQKELYKEINNLIIKKKIRINFQKLSYKNFYLNHKYISNITDMYRSSILNNLSINKKNLKIVHLTNFNHRYDGRLFYNTSKRLNNGFISLNHAVLEISDRDETHYNKSLNDLNGEKKLNQKLINVCKNFKPDLILLGHADKIKLKTLEKIKFDFPNIKISQWFLDPITKSGPDYNKNKKRLLDKFPILDATFVTTHPDVIDFIKNKDKIFFIPNPVDQSIDNLNISKNKVHKFDVFFALSHGVHRGILKKGKLDNRTKILDLIYNNKKIKTNFFGYKNKQPIWSNSFLTELSKCKLGLNLSRGKPVKYYSSDRIAQFMGNGVPTLIDYNTKYQDFFTNNEAIFYKDKNELIRKILFYKDKPNLLMKIGNNGKKKYHKYFNNKLVCEFMIKKNLNVNYKKKFYWEK